MKRFHILSASIVAAVAILAAGLTAWLVRADDADCRHRLTEETSRHQLFIAGLLAQVSSRQANQPSSLSSMLRAIPKSHEASLVYAGQVGSAGDIRDLWLRKDANRFLSQPLPKDSAQALASLSREHKTSASLVRFNVSLPDNSRLKLGFQAPTSGQPTWWPSILILVLGLAAAVSVGLSLRPREGKARGLLTKALKEARPTLLEQPASLEELARRTGELCRTQAKSLAQFQAYFAQPIFHRLSTGQSLGGEERAVAVMQIQLRDIADRLATEANDKVLALANQYLDAVIEVLIHRNAVIGSIGLDGVEAWWGSPEDCVEPEAQACKAAAEIRRSIFELERRQQTIGNPVAHVSIGIASGRCLLARLGSTRQMRPALVGRAVEDAMRVAAMAGPEEILVSQATAMLVQDAGLRLESLSSPDQEGTVWRLLSEKG